MTKILELICAALRSMNYIAAINTYPQSHCKKYILAAYRMKTNTEFYKAQLLRIRKTQNNNY